MSYESIIYDIDDIGYFIKALRNQYGISQRMLSEWSGIQRYAISKLENGKVDNVKWYTVAKILGVLKTKIVFDHSLEYEYRRPCP